MDEQCAEVHETSINWLLDVIDKVIDLDASLTEIEAAKFWSAVAQEAACAANVMVRHA